MHDDEVVVSDETARALVGAQFPEWADLPMPRIAGDGTVNAIFRVGDELTARFPLRLEDAEEVERMLRREADSLARLADAVPIAAPRPVALGRSGAGYPMPWSVQMWVNGEVVTPTSVAASTGVAAEIADLVTALREVPTDGRPFHGRGRGGVLAAHDERMTDWISRSEGLVDAAAVTDLWSILRSEPPPAELAMTHGDLTPPNLLAADGRLVGVLDGGGFGPADPSLDLVVAWHAFDAPARSVLRERIGVGDAEWRRGAGWALEQAMGLVWYYRVSNPGMAALGRSTVARLLASPQLLAP